MATEEEKELIDVAAELIDKLAKPTMVFRYARARLDRPGAEKRMINAAREIVQAVEDCEYFA